MSACHALPKYVYLWLGFFVFISFTLVGLVQGVSGSRRIPRERRRLFWRDVNHSLDAPARDPFVRRTNKFLFCFYFVKDNGIFEYFALETKTK